MLRPASPPPDRRRKRAKCTSVTLDPFSCTMMHVSLRLYRGENRPPIITASMIFPRALRAGFLPALRFVNIGGSK